MTRIDTNELREAIDSTGSDGLYASFLCDIASEAADELDRLYHIEAKTNPSLEGLRIPIFAKRETLKPQILHDCGVAIGELFPIVSNWLSIAADELADHAPLTREELEKVLMEEGWVITVAIGKQVEWQLPTKDEDEMASFAIFWNDGGFTLEMSGKCAPILRLSKVEHVTRATLRSCGVIE